MTDVGGARWAGLPTGENTRFREPCAFFPSPGRPLNYAHTSLAIHPAFNTPRNPQDSRRTDGIRHTSATALPESLHPHLIRVMTLEAIRYRSGSLQILNQLLLPHETVFDEIRSVRDGYEAIKSMKVRKARSTDPLPGSVHTHPSISKPG